MYQPKLGVSLHDIVSEIVPEQLDAFRGSPVATTEVMARFFLETPDLPGAVAPLLEMLDATGIRVMTIHALFGGAYDYSVLSDADRDAALAHADLAIEVATLLGAPMIVMHSSAEPVLDEDRESRLARAQDAFLRIGAKVAAAGKRVAIEYLPRTCLGNTVAELERILEPLDPATFGVCLDVNHPLNRAAELPDIVRELGDLLITTHLSDFDDVDEKHWPPGRGVIDWHALKLALDDIGYAGPFNYECHFDGDTPAERMAELETNFTWLSKV